MSRTTLKNFNSEPTLEQQLLGIARHHGFDRVGVTRLENPITLHLYSEWIQEGLNADMGYLARHLPFKEDPTRVLPRAESAIVVAVDYEPHPAGPAPFSALRIARYAQGQDYHLWLQEKLEVFARALKAEFPDHEFLAATDSKPILERDLAYRAGLGWFGKNTCLIDQKAGSLFLIGEVLTTIPIEKRPAVLHPDRCGTCTRCIDACPTGALIAPRKLDSSKCISYLTIEAKSVPSTPLREKMGDWVFGCDICQTVCPWNEKAFGPAISESSTKTVDPHQLIEELRFLLTADEQSLKERLKSTPLLRPKLLGLRRNALVVAGNLALVELKPEIEALLAPPELHELAAWALDRVSNRNSF